MPSLVMHMGLYHCSECKRLLDGIDGMLDAAYCLGCHSLWCPGCIKQDSKKCVRKECGSRVYGVAGNVWDFALRYKAQYEA